MNQSQFERAEEAREFTLGAVLNITTGKLLTDIGDVYQILNFMTGESLMTHQLPRASRACRPALIGQHPDLADMDASSVHDPASAAAFLRTQVRRLGRTRRIEPLLSGAYTAMDPIAEAVSMVGADRVIVVKS